MEPKSQIKEIEPDDMKIQLMNRDHKDIRRNYVFVSERQSQNIFVKRNCLLMVISLAMLFFCSVDVEIKIIITNSQMSVQRLFSWVTDYNFLSFEGIECEAGVKMML